jgi:RimJ/RimL family protein N-acetyltransferase
MKAGKGRLNKGRDSLTRWEKQMLPDFPRAKKLDDGTAVSIRIKDRDDLDTSMQFYASMPEQERELMRIDVTDRNVVAGRFDEIEKGHADYLIALVGDRIVGEAILENLRYGWLRKTGDIRILILPEFRKSDLAGILAREIFLLAARRGLNNVIARVLDGETWMIDTLRKLHFKHEATQKRHAVDLHDNQHDVLLMTYSLTKMWSDIEDKILDSISSPEGY